VRRFESLTGIRVRDIDVAATAARERLGIDPWVVLVPPTMLSASVRGAAGSGPAARLPGADLLGRLVAWFRDEVACLERDGRPVRDPFGGPPPGLRRWPDPDAAKLARSVARLLRELLAGVAIAGDAEMSGSSGHDQPKGDRSSADLSDETSVPAECPAAQHSVPQTPCLGPGQEGGEPPVVLEPAGPPPTAEEVSEWLGVERDAMDVRARLTWARAPTERATALRAHLGWDRDRYDQFLVAVEDLERSAEFLNPRRVRVHEDAHRPFESFGWLCLKAAEVLVAGISPADGREPYVALLVERVALFLVATGLATQDAKHSGELFVNLDRLQRRVKQAVYRRT
jgi:hypothetical protein